MQDTFKSAFAMSKLKEAFKTVHKTIKYSKAFEPPPCVKELRRALREQHGSILKGWRIALDPDCGLTCSFKELCVGAARIHFVGNVGELFQLHQEQKVLHLRDVEPNLSAVLEKMRHWIHDIFGSSEELFNQFDVSGDGQLSLSEFSEACLQHGFSASESQLKELFEGLDLEGNGLISKDDVVILELDAEERQAMLAGLANQKNEENNRLLQELHSQLSLKPVGPMHRLADRPWHTIVEMPEVVSQKRTKRLQKAVKEKEEALALFQQHLKSAYGNEVRAWRRALCPGNYQVVNRKQLMSYCRRVEFEGNSSALWDALDRDNEGSISMEEVTPKYARILSRFRQWASCKVGKCVKLWRTEAFQAGEKKSGSVRKMYGHDFATAVISIGYDADPVELRLLSSGLDLSGIGFVSVEDLLWLDTWSPPLWLLAQPDRRAMQNFRLLLLEKFGSFVLAWRQLLDQDGTNRVSWNEFEKACKSLGFKHSIEGTWRALDEDASGWISLKEVDRGSHDMLESFKHWADKNFGSVSLAFNSLDKDKSGKLTFSELRRACAQLNWGGNPRELFDALNNPANGGQGREIALKEVAFLDTYVEDVTCDGDQARPVPLKTRSKTPMASPIFYCTKTASELASMQACSNSKKVVGDAERRPHISCMQKSSKSKHAVDDVQRLSKSRPRSAATEGCSNTSTVIGDVKHLFKSRPCSAATPGYSSSNKVVNDVEHLFKVRPRSACIQNCPTSANAIDDVEHLFKSRSRCAAMQGCSNSTKVFDDLEHLFKRRPRSAERSQKQHIQRRPRSAGYTQ